MTNHLQYDPRDFNQNYPTRSFACRHDLAEHRLFNLPRLIELAKSMDRDRIEYNSGDLEPGHAYEDTPKVDLSVEETIRQIEDCHAWMVIKNVEQDPEYKAFIKTCLDQVSERLPQGAEPLEDYQGFIFIASANSTTPFHIDAEENFFVQLHGSKSFHVFENDDCKLVSEEAMEISPSKFRNMSYSPEFENRATVYELGPGDGIFVPYMMPHWVRTGDQYSISMAITWKTPSVLRRNKVRFMNAMLRQVGLAQAAPGQKPWADGLKVAAYDMAFAVINPLRKSEKSRRIIRKLFFGRNANYYYNEKNA